MRLDSKDVEAIAKSRTVRAEGNRGTMWTVGAMVAVVVGFFLLQSGIANANVIGLVVCIGGFCSFLWYMYTLNKKQNAAKIKLLKEWRQEQGQK